MTNVVFIWLAVFQINYVQDEHTEARLKMLAAACVWVCKAPIPAVQRVWIDGERHFE